MNLTIETRKPRYQFKSGSIQHNTQKNKSNLKGLRFTNYNNQDKEANIYIDDSM